MDIRRGVYRRAAGLRETGNVEPGVKKVGNPVLSLQDDKCGLALDFVDLDLDVSLPDQFCLWLYDFLAELAPSLRFLPELPIL